MAALLSIDEALARILARVEPLEAEAVPVADAAGRFLAEDAVATVDLPPFRSSAMDGYAVRAAETPGTLPVVFRIAAGVPAPAALEAGQAMAISTGGTVPEGADAVVPIELVVEQDNNLVVREPVEPGAHVRPVGGDVQGGAVVLAAGARIGAPQVGALAAAGIATVRVARQPRVAVLSTGTELRAPGEALAPGQIYESNGAMLAATFADAGVVERIGPVPDDDASHRAALEHGLDADVLVSSGGVSVGPHDLVRRILTELGAEEEFWGVAVRPGKPLAFSTLGRTLVFGLPGNPVSSLVSAELFVRPALHALQGAEAPGPHWQVGTLAAPIRRSPARPSLVRARRDGDRLEALSGQESHMIVRAAGADALVLVPAGDGELAAGEQARYVRV